MRVSLETDPAEFIKQVADLRRFLNRQEQKGGQAAMSARMMTASFVPLLNTLRTELRADKIELEVVMTGIADLVGNITMTMIQSLFDAPPEAQEEALDRLLGGAKATVMRMIDNDARMARDTIAKAKPKLAILNGGKG